jgi:enoyl-CoA hydratase
MGVNVERQGAIVVVTIDRPERRNALDSEAISGIGSAFDAAERDDGVRVVVLTGAGDRAFCSGMDLKEFASAAGDRRRPAGPGLEVLMTRCYPKPVIAAVNGSATGGGFELVMASDMAVAVETATFSVPEVRRGLVGAGCSTRLAARVPAPFAFEMAVLGEPITAERALSLGLINEVVPAGAALERSLAIAESLAASAPLAVKVTKQLIWDEIGSHDADEWTAIRSKAGPVFASDDAREGSNAFLEKRPPVWSGH